MTIKEKYQQACAMPSDVFEHLPILKRYADQCEVVVELGVRNVVSTWALLASSAKKVYGYDIETQPQVKECQELCEKEGRHWEYIESDVLKIQIPECQLLWIDTFHSALQMKQELALHADKATKLIIAHDSTTFWENSENSYNSAAANQVDGPEGLKYAFEPFLQNHPEWVIHERLHNNNGLLILKRLF